MSRYIQRAELLMRQERYDKAIEELQKALADDPDDPMGHVLLSYSLSELKQHSLAIQHAEQAISIAPDLDIAHSALARAFNLADKPRKALAPASEAIRLDPYDATNYAVKAAVHMHLSQWSEALDCADAGLGVDAENDECANLRSAALMQLGRKDEASAAAENQLNRNPDDSFSHANMGWNYLQKNKPREAVDHFREALRLEPDMDWARMGIIEALKARNPFYALVLRYFLWMGRIPRNIVWAMMIGIVVLLNFSRRLADQYPVIEPIVHSVLILYMLFVLVSWMASPLFNLLLRFDRDGRHALSDHEKMVSNWLAATIGFAIIAGGFNAFLLNAAGESPSFWFIMAPLLMIFPVMTATSARKGPARIITSLIAIAALLCYLGTFMLSNPALLVPYSWICILSSWVTSFIPSAD